MSSINPEILVWARETAGLALEEAAKKLGFQTSNSSSAAEKLKSLENGVKPPTRAQLLKMADQYRRPLLTFYLSKPPAKGDRGADFRTLPADTSNVEDALLDALLRDVRARQSMVRAVLEDEEEAESLTFVGSHRLEDGQPAVLESLKKLLDLELAEFRDQRNPSTAFDLLRSSAERAGVYVLIKGDLGNYQTAIDTKTYRGFSIADGVAPFVVINDQDARPAWSFTLLHEMVHLLLGETGVGSASTDSERERFCDAVAGEYLLPQEELAGFSINVISDHGALSERISGIANQLNVSRTMVAYNALTFRLINQGTFDKLRAEFYQQWRNERERARTHARNQETGPSFYVVRRHRLGHRITDLVRRMVAGDVLSTSKAARILGVKARQVQPLLNAGRSL